MNLLDILKQCPILSLDELIYGLARDYVFRADVVSFLGTYGPYIFPDELGKISPDFSNYIGEDDASRILYELVLKKQERNQDTEFKWAFLLLSRIASEWDNLVAPEEAVEDIISTARSRRLDALNRSFTGAAGAILIDTANANLRMKYRRTLEQELATLKAELCPSA